MRVVAKPIEMIAWFNIEGIPNPVRFRFQNEEEVWTIIKVDRIITKDIEKLAGNYMYVFRCQSAIDGMEKVYELKYELATCKWILFKI